MDLLPGEKEFASGRNELSKTIPPSQQESNYIDHTEAQLSLTSHINAPEQVVYPEGGLRAWLVVLGSFCGILASFGFMNSSKSQCFRLYAAQPKLRTTSERLPGIPKPQPTRAVQ
jgi:hypothetical protein